MKRDCDNYKFCYSVADYEALSNYHSVTFFLCRKCLDRTIAQFETTISYVPILDLELDLPDFLGKRLTNGIEI